MRDVDDDEFFRGLIWNQLPEARDLMKELERDELELAADLGMPQNGRVGSYSYASIVLVDGVLEPALKSAPRNADLLARVARVLEAAVDSGRSYLQEAVSLRVTDFLVGSPEYWLAFREHAGPALSADARERGRYVEWWADAPAPREP